MFFGTTLEFSLKSETVIDTSQHQQFSVSSNLKPTHNKTDKKELLHPLSSGIPVVGNWNHINEFCSKQDIGCVKDNIRILSVQDTLFVSFHYLLHFCWSNIVHCLPIENDSSSITCIDNNKNEMNLDFINASNYQSESISFSSSQQNADCLEANPIPCQNHLLDCDFFTSMYTPQCMKQSEILFDLLSKAQPNPNDAKLKFAVYYWWKTRGWVIKSGLKFGVDFLLYDQSPSLVHARYALYILRPWNKTRWREIYGLSRLAVSVVKELMITTVVDPTSNFTDMTLKDALTMQLHHMKLSRGGTKQ